MNCSSQTCICFARLSAEPHDEPTTAEKIATWHRSINDDWPIDFRWRVIWKHRKLFSRLIKCSFAGLLFTLCPMISRECCTMPLLNRAPTLHLQWLLREISPKRSSPVMHIMPKCTPDGIYMPSRPTKTKLLSPQVARSCQVHGIALQSLYAELLRINPKTTEIFDHPRSGVVYNFCRVCTCM